MDLDVESAVHEWIMEYPPAMRLFERLGIDTSCGGKSLQYACLEQGLNPRVVMARLQELMEPDEVG